MEIIFLIYGLSFLAVGLTVVIRYDHDSQLKLASILWLLGAFGFIHGFREWMDLWTIIHGPLYTVDALKPFFLMFSYLILFEFGRKLVRVSQTSLDSPWPIAWLSHKWIYIPLIAMIFIGVAVADQHELAMDVWSRYLLGFPGAMLAGFGFLSYGKNDISGVLDRAEGEQVKAAFTITGVAFIAYGVFGGLVVPRSGWLPASIINQETFKSAVGVPVQVFRAACAVQIALGVGVLLKVFHMEAFNRLQESERRFHGMADNAQDAIVEVDETGCIKFWNPAAERLFGHTVSQALGQKFVDVIIPRRFRGPFRDISSFFATLADGVTRERSVEFVGLHSDGRELQLEATIGILPTANGRHAIGILRDISRRREIEQRLKLGDKVITHAHDGIMVTDNEVRIQLINPAFTRITGYLPEDVIGKTPRLLSSGRHSRIYYEDMWQSLGEKDEWQGEIWNRRRDGGIYPEWLSLSAIRDASGNVTNFIGIFSDITRRKETEQDLERLAFFDPLTGLANRTLFHERLSQALRDIKRYGSFRTAVLYLDLDLFKGINDQYGHHVGDALLVQVGKRLSAAVRDTDTVARLGGDEFAIVLTHLVEAALAYTIAAKIVDLISEPFIIDSLFCQIGVSVGIAIAPDHGIEVKELVAYADQAMYEAKRAGHNQHRKE